MNIIDNIYKLFMALFIDSKRSLVRLRSSFECRDSMAEIVRSLVTANIGAYDVTCRKI
jgi:hypothetical protein